MARGESVERLHAALCYAYQPVVLGGRELHEKIVDGVNRLAVVDDFVVEVRARTATRAAHVADDRGTLHHIPHLGCNLGKVGVPGFKTATMVDLDEIPVELVVRKLSEGLTDAELLEAYPQLQVDDIRAALAYAAASLAHETILIGRVA